MCTPNEKAILDLAREIAFTVDESTRPRVFALIALFSRSADDIKLATSTLAANKVILIKVLLALSEEREALNVAASFNRDNEKEEKSEAELAIVTYYLFKEIMPKAKERLLAVRGDNHKVIALSRFVKKQTEIIEKRDREIAELQREVETAKISSLVSVASELRSKEASDPTDPPSMPKELQEPQS